MGVFNDIVVNKLKIMDPKDLHKLFFPYNLGAYHYHKKNKKGAYRYYKNLKTIDLH